MISLTNFAGASKDDKLKFAFMIFDEDGNGVITKQEVRRREVTTARRDNISGSSRVSFLSPPTKNVINMTYL